MVKLNQIFVCIIINICSFAYDIFIVLSFTCIACNYETFGFYTTNNSNNDGYMVIPINRNSILLI